MIFTVICPSDTSGRRKGGLITIVFSFFGLPKYLCREEEGFQWFIPLFIGCLPCVKHKKQSYKASEKVSTELISLIP